MAPEVRVQQLQGGTLELCQGEAWRVAGVEHQGHGSASEATVNR